MARNNTDKKPVNIFVKKDLVERLQKRGFNLSRWFEAKAIEELEKQ